MNTVKFLAKLIAWGLLVALWAWAVFIQLPVLLVAGPPSTYIGYGVFALAVLVPVGIAHWFFKKGSTKEKSNEVSDASGHRCGPGCDHGRVQ